MHAQADLKGSRASMVTTQGLIVVACRGVPTHLQRHRMLVQTQIAGQNITLLLSQDAKQFRTRL